MHKKPTGPMLRRQPRKRGYKRVLATNGYIQVWVGKDHYLADTKGYAYEHRVVAEQKLGRRLLPGEVVHHIDRDRTNNDPVNLEVFRNHHAHNSEHRIRAKGLRLPGEPNPEVLCECGCGTAFLKYDYQGRPRRFVTGHNGKPATGCQRKGGKRE